jgi:hypothetical protein
MPSCTYDSARFIFLDKVASCRHMLVCFSPTLLEFPTVGFESLLCVVSYTEISINIILTVLVASLTRLHSIDRWGNLCREPSFRRTEHSIFPQVGRIPRCIIRSFMVYVSLQTRTNRNVSKVTWGNVGTRTWSVESWVPIGSLLLFSKDPSGNCSILTYLLDTIATVSDVVVSTRSRNSIVTGWRKPQPLFLGPSCWFGVIVLRGGVSTLSIKLLHIIVVAWSWYVLLPCLSSCVPKIKFELHFETNSILS